MKSVDYLSKENSVLPATTHSIGLAGVARDSMTLPHVFIIVLSWNNQKHTVECLASLSQLSYPDAKIALVDNGSTDATIATVCRQFPSVHIIENGRNFGFAEGNNVGIRYALEHEADHILLLNNDTVISPDMVSQLVHAAEKDSTIGFVCPSIRSYFDSSKQYIGADINWKSGQGCELERSPEGLPEILDTDYAPGCALLVKSDVVRRIGLLDSAYFAYFEDVDWSLRCRKAGYRVVVVPQAEIQHKGSLDQYQNKSSFAMYYYRRNQFLFMRKYLKWKVWPQFLKNNVRQCLLQLKDAIESNDRNLEEAIIDGWWAGIAGHYGAGRVQAPAWFKKIVSRRVDFFLHLITPVVALRRHLPLKASLQ